MTCKSSVKRAVVRSDGKRYNSVAEASRDTGVAATNISRCINHPERNKMAGGYAWSYSPYGWAIPVFVDGILVSSLSEAAKRIGVHKTSVLRALRFGDGLIKGHHVKYAFKNQIKCPCCNGRGIVERDA